MGMSQPSGAFVVEVGQGALPELGGVVGIEGDKSGIPGGGRTRGDEAGPWAVRSRRENVYKIGMTRRLEPMDRVKELGDASVPFVFDVHAMIYADDAPAVGGTSQSPDRLVLLELRDGQEIGPQEIFNDPCQRPALSRKNRPTAGAATATAEKAPFAMS